MAGQLEETGPPPPTLTGPLVLPAPQAFCSVGQLYHGIERGLRGLVDRYGEGQVFVCVCWWVRGWSGVGG
jgi:hypothetical protein